MADAQVRVSQSPLAQQRAGGRVQRHQRRVHAPELTLAAPGFRQCGDAAVGHHQGTGRKAAHRLRQGQQLVRVHAVRRPLVGFLQRAGIVHAQQTLRAVQIGFGGPEGLRVAAGNHMTVEAPVRVDPVPLRAAAAGMPAQQPVAGPACDRQHMAIRFTAQAVRPCGHLQRLLHRPGLLPHRQQADVLIVPILPGRQKKRVVSRRACGGQQQSARSQRKKRPARNACVNRPPRSRRRGASSSPHRHRRIPVARPARRPLLPGTAWSRP